LPSNESWLFRGAETTCSKGRFDALKLTRTTRLSGRQHSTASIGFGVIRIRSAKHIGLVGMESRGALHAMNRRINLDAQLESTLKNNSSRRAFAARLDMTIKRAKVASSRVARSLGVPERDVTLWRAGVIVPKSTDCARLSEVLDVDVAWLCAGQA
jgi:hypothetical protein